MLTNLHFCPNVNAFDGLGRAEHDAFVKRHIFLTKALEYVIQRARERGLLRISLFLIPLFQSLASLLFIKEHSALFPDAYELT